MRFIAFLLAGTVLSTPVLAATIEVRPGDNLQAAIRSAKPGDTVAVSRGTYNGSLELSGLHGQPGAPIRIVSVDGHGAAVIRGSQNRAAVQANRITNVEMDGFHVVANAPGGGDVGGFKIWGPYADVGNLKFTNNLITGVGQDGFKLFNGANNVVVAGNTIDGNWRQEAIDNVSVKNVTYEGNTIKGKAGFAGITWKAGSDGVKLVNNTIDIDADTAVSVGGYGNSRLARMDRFPDEYKDNEAENSVVTGNQIRGDVRVISAENNRITGNNVTGSISNGRNVHMPGSITSRNNTIADNGAAVEGADEWDGETILPGASESDDDDSSGYDGGMGAIMSSAGGAIGGSCAGSGAMSNASAAAGAVWSIFTGGRATAPLQVAQQLQLVAQRICQTEQLMAQLKMLSGMDLRTADEVMGVLTRLDPMLRQGQFLMTDQAIMKAMEEAYPEAFPEGSTYGDMENQQIIWNERTRSALDQKTRIENSVLRSQGTAMRRAVAIEQAGRDSGGIRGAQLATNALLTELMGSLNGQIAVTAAHHRALTEVQYREEAERAAAKRDAQDFMAGFGDCPECGQRPIAIFGNGGTVGRRGIAADPFGTGVP